MTLALITGATGFVGKALVPFLLKKEIRIRILTRNKIDIFTNSIQQHVGDLTDKNSLIGCTNDVDIVFHLGGYANASDNDIFFHEVNLYGTKNIINEAIKSKPKFFIYFSSIKASPDLDDNINICEKNNHPYGKYKKLAEDYVLYIGKNHDLNVSILRLPPIYGKNLKGNLYTLLYYIDKYPIILPKVNNRISLVSLNDTCQAAWLAANSEKSNGKVYFVNDNVSYSTHEICEQFCNGLGKIRFRWPVPLVMLKTLAFIGNAFQHLGYPSFPLNLNSYKKIFDSSECSSYLIMKDLGYHPQYTLTNLIPEIIEAYKNNEI